MLNSGEIGLPFSNTGGKWKRIEAGYGDQKQTLFPSCPRQESELKFIMWALSRGSMKHVIVIYWFKMRSLIHLRRRTSLRTGKEILWIPCEWICRFSQPAIADRTSVIRRDGNILWSTAGATLSLSLISTCASSRAHSRRTCLMKP